MLHKFVFIRCFSAVVFSIWNVCVNEHRCVIDLLFFLQFISLKIRSIIISDISGDSPLSSPIKTMEIKPSEKETRGSIVKCFVFIKHGIFLIKSLTLRHRNFWSIQSTLSHIHTQAHKMVTLLLSDLFERKINVVRWTKTSHKIIVHKLNNMVCSAAVHSTLYRRYTTHCLRHIFCTLSEFTCW